MLLWTAIAQSLTNLIFIETGIIIDAAINYPGSWHDSKVARSIYTHLDQQVPDGFWLVADSAFPRGAGTVRDKIKAPIKAGMSIPRDPDLQREVLAFNRQLLSYRQTAEWGMKMMQGSFGRLQVPLPISDTTLRKKFIETCMRLFNLRSARVGINQIHSVYEPIWRKSEDEQLWDDLGSMLFGDIRRSRLDM